MVQKTSHRGVYSGNTLRVSNSRFCRRYHTQACIVSRLRPELLKKLEAGAAANENGSSASKRSSKEADDTKIGKKPCNNSVDVPLSLNKQARWLLPHALIRQIQTDNIADSEITLSVLERHKLKRPASCVSFHSNHGEVKRIQPRSGRYFCYNFPTADGKSRRTLRRERRKLLEEELRNNKVEKLVGATVEVFTEQGRAKRNMEIGESEVRYEVFYPSPASSSISHNPKYIKQDIDVTSQDSEEHAQHGKPRKQHRGKRRPRMTLKDLDDWELLPAGYPPQPSFSAVVDTVDQDFVSRLDFQEERNPTECLLSSLIEKAQQVQNLKGTSRLRRTKKTKSSVHHEGLDKPHIVYLDESSQTHPAEDERFDDKSEQASPLPLNAPSPIPSESARVLLPKDEVTEAGLRECFGECYVEVDCSPRKFVLDVTSSVRELLKKEGIQGKVAEKTEEVLSYLICVHDGFYDDDWDVYRVLLNSRLHKGLLAVELKTEETQDLPRASVMTLVSHTMDFMQGMVASLTDNHHFPMFLKDKRAIGSPRHLNSHLGSSKAYVPSVERLFHVDAVSSFNPTTLQTISEMLEEGPVFCDVCYDDISPWTLDSAHSTSLQICQHRVCDSCWAQHIHVRLHEGFVRVTCPGYDCQQDARIGVMLSVAPLDTVEKLLHRQEEVRIGASSTEKWCPNESCGRVISLQNSYSSSASSSSSSSSFSSSSSPSVELQLQQDIVCACGTHVCFQCLMPAHWPASCKQAEDYRNSLPSTVFPDRLAEVHDDFKADHDAKFKREMEKKCTMLVEGKHCPKCKSFVFKNGGCPQMTCRCGQLFCWFCAKPGYAHHDRRGCVDVNQEKKLTTTIVVHHLENTMGADDSKKQQQQAAAGSRRRRTSLMERAVEHRRLREKKQTNSQAITALTKAVTTASAKSKPLAQRITEACSEAFSSTPEQNLTGAKVSASDPSSSTVMETVSAFLKNVVHSKQELLEVVEYSLVLLKDLPDSLPKRRALRVSEDLGAFCSFVQSVLDVWGRKESCPTCLQEAVKAVLRLVEIQGWIHKALDTHVVTVRKLRSLSLSGQ